MDKQEILQEIADIRNNLDSFSPKMADRLFQMLASTSDRVVSSSVIQALYAAQIQYPGVTILYFGNMSDALEPVGQSSNASMFILDIFLINDKGIAVTGFVMNGDINAGNQLLLQKSDGRDIKVQCIGVLHDIDKSSSILLKKENISVAEISQGDRLVAI